jgi:pentatricopeptide repeat protein
VASFTSALGALSKSQQAVRAHDLLQAMASRHGLSPDVDMLESVLEMLQAAGEEERARAVERELMLRGGGAPLA